MAKYMTWDIDPYAVATNTLDYYWDPITWLFPPVPLIPLALERVLQQQIMAILICLGWTGAMWWPQLVELRTEMAPIHLPAVADCLKFPKGSMEELPNFSHQWESHLESGNDNPEVLHVEDLAFLLNHIRKGTRGTYKSGWCQFKTFCDGFGTDPQWA